MNHRATLRLVLSALISPSLFIFASCTSAPVGLSPIEQLESLAPSPAPNSVPPPGFKVAYVGDQGSTPDSVRVLELIKSEKTDLFILAGDFDYKDDPKAWDKMMRDGIGDLPVLAVVGNHDVKKWDDYAELLQKRLAAMPKAHCLGIIGVQQRCEYEGLVFVLSGVGTLGSGHEAFLKKALEAPAPIKICVWHKNQHLMQAGTKEDEVGWAPYEIRRREGAMIATGHEHSYARTHLLRDFEKQTVADYSASMTLEKGKSIAFVSGLGGKSIRPQAQGGSWWGKVYTATQGARPGALFCSYNVEGNPKKSHCYFKNIDGAVIDDFSLTSRLTP